MKIKVLTTPQEMVDQIEVMRFLYPNLTQEKYSMYLQEMVKHNYIQIAVFDQEECLGITGCWFSVKLWSGKYLEIDNFIVHPEHRKKGIAKLLTDFIEQKAIDLGCTNIVLDAFSENFEAHRFYYNQGYGPRGFHFVKIIDKEGLT
jgi:GNAT superfamily N-acetyltransferase